MKTEIFKIQKPLMTNGDMNELLIYNEDQSILTTYVATDEEVEEIFGDELKVYVEATIGDDGKLNIQEFLEEQEW